MKIINLINGVVVTTITVLTIIGFCYCIGVLPKEQSVNLTVDEKTVIEDHNYTIRVTVTDNVIFTSVIHSDSCMNDKCVVIRHYNELNEGLQ